MIELMQRGIILPNEDISGFYLLIICLYTNVAFIYDTDNIANNLSAAETGHC